MGKIETVIKSEITRLVRRELRPVLTPLLRQSRSLNRQTRVLAAQVDRLRKQVSRLENARMESVSQLSPSEADLDKSRISGGLIKKLRAKQGLTQGQLASLIEVSPAAVQSWEQGIARPGGSNKAALVALRKLGRRDVIKLLEEKGVKAGRKPRIDGQRKAKPKKAKAPKARKKVGKRGKKARRG